MQIHELIRVVLRKGYDIVQFSFNNICLLKLFRLFITGHAHKLVLLLVVESDFSLMVVALKSDVLHLFNLIILWLIDINDCQLKFNAQLVEFGDGIALGTGAVDVNCLLIIALPKHQACHTNHMLAVHQHWKLPLVIESAFAAYAIVI